jgi:hypothetical protein
VVVLAIDDGEFVARQRKRENCPRRATNPSATHRRNRQRPSAARQERQQPAVIVGATRRRRDARSPRSCQRTAHRSRNFTLAGKLESVSAVEDAALARSPVWRSFRSMTLRLTAEILTADPSAIIEGNCGNR